MEQDYKRNAIGQNWLFFAILACICAGFANYFIGFLSSKYNWMSMFPAWIGQFTMFLIYHLYIVVKKWQAGKDSDQVEYVNYGQNPQALFAVIIRGVGHMGMMTGCTLAFAYADKAHVNQGIIGGLFVS